MLGDILFIWILSRLSAPIWCYILTAVSIVIKLVGFGAKIGKAAGKKGVIFYVAA